MNTAAASEVKKTQGLLLHGSQSARIGRPRFSSKHGLFMPNGTALQLYANPIGRWLLNDCPERQFQLFSG
jgi:hypothetical protein